MVLKASKADSPELRESANSHLRAVGGTGAGEAAVRLPAIACFPAGSLGAREHKRVLRVYREAGLTVKRKRRKRLVRVGCAKPLLTAASQEWALDSAHDGMASGRAVRVLSVMDAST